MISVAMTTYNGEKYLKEQLISVLNQTMHVDEIVISDDCSDDETYYLLLDFANKYKNIKLFRNIKKIGFIDNFHFVISKCTGDFIFLCDQDDIWNSDKVERMIRIMYDKPNIQVLASSFSLIDSNDNVIRYNHSLFRSNNDLLSKRCKNNAIIKIDWNDILFHNFSQGASLLFTKKIQQFYINNYTNNIFHDYYLNFIGAYIDSLYFYNAKLFNYRLHSSNTIGFTSNLSIHEKTTISYCLKEPKRAYLYLKKICELFPDTLTKYPDTVKAIHFLENYINSFYQKKLFYILFLNFSPWYFKLKTIKGRVIDILTILKPF